MELAAWAKARKIFQSFCFKHDGNNPSIDVSIMAAYAHDELGFFESDFAQSARLARGDMTKAP